MYTINFKLKIPNLLTLSPNPKNWSPHLLHDKPFFPPISSNIHTDHLVQFQSNSISLFMVCFPKASLNSLWFGILLIEIAHANFVSLCNLINLGLNFDLNRYWINFFDLNLLFKSKLSRQNRFQQLKKRIEKFKIDWIY